MGKRKNEFAQLRILSFPTIGLSGLLSYDEKIFTGLSLQEEVSR